MCADARPCPDQDRPARAAETGTVDDLPDGLNPTCSVMQENALTEPGMPHTENCTVALSMSSRANGQNTWPTTADAARR